MKLLLITSLKEYQKAVAGIINQAGIEVFSVSETSGFKDHQTSSLMDNWFASGSVQFDSIFLFSFTEEAKAKQALDMIKKYNEENKTGFPLRAFILPVEQSSYTGK